MFSSRAKWLKSPSTRTATMSADAGAAVTVLGLTDREAVADEIADHRERRLGMLGNLVERIKQEMRVELQLPDFRLPCVHLRLDRMLALALPVNPPDIDQIAPGQSAQVKIHTFNQRTTPELAGTVSRIAADTSRDERTGALFYTIRVRLPADELTRLAPQRLPPACRPMSS